MILGLIVSYLKKYSINKCSHNESFITLFTFTHYHVLSSFLIHNSSFETDSLRPVVYVVCSSADALFACRQGRGKISCKIPLILSNKINITLCDFAVQKIIAPADLASGGSYWGLTQ